MNSRSHRLLRRDQVIFFGVISILGFVLFALGLAVDAPRAWRNLLLNNFYLLAISLMGTVFVAIHYLVRGGWATVLRRIPEALVGYLPVGSALMILLLVGLPSVYHWAEPHAMEHDAILEAKSPFLNAPFFIARMFFYLGVWYGLSRAIVRLSLRQDTSTDLGLTERNVHISAIFIIVFGLTFSLASIDWIMSLEPHWYSTLFPWYVMSSTFVASLALITIIAVVLQRNGTLPELNDAHMHDLGKYVFAFSVFWGYLWFSQYLLIWYSNIPEETAYYRARATGWYPLFALNPILNLGVPFILLPEKNKKNPVVLLFVCAVIIVGHWLDAYLMIMPSLMTEGPQLGWIELGTGLGVTGLFLITIDRTLTRRHLLPKGDPYFEESLTHQG